ncbi:MAG: hypothetical protein F4139_05090 [Gemmatimonadetes bacterium]|nr:hypothetical protein [Gemmatimonadota bacterium]MYK65469.1 hypothetical protein [Gemmatimonadota bacterium]
MRYRAPILILGTLAALACSSDHDSERDESGTSLETGGELSQTEPLWQIAPEPTLVLGELEGIDAYLFSQIRGATRLSTGTVVVLDGASSQLRAFSGDGTHLWTSGGSGEGPGEMRNPTHLETLPGDTIQVQDGLARIRYAADGGLIAYERLAVGDLQRFGRYYASECSVPSFVGDRVIACTGTDMDLTGKPREAGPWRLEDELAVLPWTLDSIDRLGVFLKEVGWAIPFEGLPRLPEQLVVLSGGMGYAPPPMARKGVFAVGGWPRKLAVADGWGDVVHAFDLAADSVSPGTSIAVRHARRPPTADEFAAAWEAVSARRVGSPEHIREHLPAPDSTPNIDHLVVDHPGMVWVGSYQHDRSATRLYHVYDTEGRFLARVTMPAGVEALEIGADYVLGITRDELEVERIVLHTLTRS